MNRSITKAIDAGRRVLESDKRNAALDMTISEAQAFCERLEIEHPTSVIFDAFLFGLAIGHRAGKRERGRNL